MTEAKITSAPAEEQAASPNADLLYPLSLFCQNGGHPLPSFEVIRGEEMPAPYRDLLVHNGDMTSRLEDYHQAPLELELLHRERTPEAYRREVVLRMQTSGLPVEYGAIEIDLAQFEGELRELILEEHLPLGGLLNRFGIRYCSRPLAFIQLGPDVVMQEVFQMPEAKRFYGRCNQLLTDGNRPLARIVEVLRP